MQLRAWSIDEPLLRLSDPKLHARLRDPTGILSKGWRRASNDDLVWWTTLIVRLSRHVSQACQSRSAGLQADSRI